MKFAPEALEQIFIRLKGLYDGLVENELGAAMDWAFKLLHAGSAGNVLYTFVANRVTASTDFQNCCPQFAADVGHAAGLNCGDCSLDCHVAKVQLGAIPSEALFENLRIIID